MKNFVPVRLGQGPALYSCLLLLAASAALGQPAPPGPSAPFDPRQRPGPWDHDILLYRVPTNERPRQIGTFERAGVGTVTRLKDGRLIAAHQYFPQDRGPDFDKVAVRFSSNEGESWSRPVVIRLNGLPSGFRFPFDPTLLVLADGRVRLYFTSLRGQQFEQATPAIYSAISSNGVDYTFEPGVRFAVAGRPVIDCAVALHQGMFHLYSPDNGAAGPPREPGRKGQRPAEGPREGVGYHAVSKDGLQFERADDVRMEGRRTWLGNAQSDGGVIRFFGTGEGGLWSASSEDGQSWSRPITLPGLRIADPGAVLLKDGSLIVLGTSPPRPGTRSAERTNRRDGAEAR